MTQLLLCLFVIGTSTPVQAAPSTLGFENFLSQYIKKSSETLSAQRQLSTAERNRAQQTDQWKARFTATPELSFEKQEFDSNARPNNSNRTQNVSGTFTQMMPSGTRLSLNGQKYIETQNPLYSSLDRSYSAKISQDLFKNAFGKSQRAQSNKGNLDYSVAELEYRRSLVSSCENAFSLYTDAYIQQEIANLLRAQMKDAKKALNISRKLYRDKLINKIDKLSSESDFINTQLQVDQAEQKLINSKRQIQAFLDGYSMGSFKLFDPSPFLNKNKVFIQKETLTEVIIEKRVKSQDLSLEKSRSDRWTDVELGLEVGERVGRLSINGPLINYNEEYLKATLNIGFDIINNTENAELKNAIYAKNSLVKEQTILARTQRSKVDSLTAMNDLLKQQVESSKKQVSLLEEKMNIAFGQMRRAKLDFQNYLLHRNAYLNQQRNYLNLKKDLWLNQFSIQKEFAHSNPNLCEVSS